MCWGTTESATRLRLELFDNFNPLDHCIKSDSQSFRDNGVIFLFEIGKVVLDHCLEDIVVFMGIVNLYEKTFLQVASGNTNRIKFLHTIKNSFYLMGVKTFFLCNLFNGCLK